LTSFGAPACNSSIPYRSLEFKLALLVQKPVA
jgi:hypothetical protein